MPTWTSPDEKADLIARFMAHTGCDESTAREYLRAEDWLYTEAVWTWVNDRAAEYRAWYREQVEDAVSLAHLCGLLNDYDAEAGRTRLEFVVNLLGLPTFGGEAPTSIADVWSWDETSLLYCNPDTREYYIDKRPLDQNTTSAPKYAMREELFTWFCGNLSPVGRVSQVNCRDGGWYYTVYMHLDDGGTVVSEYPENALYDWDYYHTSLLRELGREIS